MTVRFVLNGDPVEVEHADHHLTALQWLRASGRTGTKEGCSEGECGACAIAILQKDARGRPRFESINSCLVALPALHDQTIVTVEGIADPSGELHPVQQAMAASGASQCGYCTPGFVVSLFCEYYRPGRAGYDPAAIGGNLCRCTGYRPIVDVARALPVPAATDRHTLKLGEPVPEPTLFEHCSATSRFARPTDLAGVWRYLEQWPDAALIAGGTDLMVYANQRYTRFAALLSLEQVGELMRFTVDADEIVIGAGVRLSELEDRLAGEHAGFVPMLEQLLPLFSSRLVRNRATLGGNLGTASPIGDALSVLLALDADVHIASGAGERTVALTDFLRGYRKTVLAPGEVVVSIRLVLPLPQVQRFYKVSKRELDDISTVAAAFALDVGPDNRVTRLRVAYGGVAATAVRAHTVEQAAVGQPWSKSTVSMLLAKLPAIGTPLTDHRGSGAYRRAMMGKLLEKFFAASARATAGAA